MSSPDTHALPPRAAASPLSDGEWHRLHPLTPLLRGGLVLVVAVGIVIANLRERLVEWFLPVFAPDLPNGRIPGDPVDFIVAQNLVTVAVVGLLVVVLVVIGLFTLSWRFHSFRITGDEVEVRQGVLFRSLRKAPLDRVQGVNLVRPLVARLLGMAKLEIVGAGFGAGVRLEYLSTANAEAVRADILRLASGARHPGPARDAAATEASPGRTTLASAAVATVGGAVSDLVAGADRVDAEPDSVVTIPTVRLVLSKLLDGTAVAAVVTVGIIVGIALAGAPLFSIVLVFAALAFIGNWVRTLLKSLRYSIAPTSGGVRITFGLLTTVTETVPPGRVHAVEIRQPLLWRPAGWWTITVNRLHGGSSADGSSEGSFSVLPVGRRTDVEAVLRLLLPGLDDLEWSAVFEHGILGPQSDDPYTNTPRRARLLRPLSWRRNGFLLGRDALLLRRGFLWRSLVIVPLARMQSFSIEQGPIDRALAVAGAHAHTIPGRVPTRLGAIGRDDAVALLARAEVAVVAASRADRSHRWADGAST